MKIIKIQKSLPDRKKTIIDISNCNSIQYIISNEKSQLYLINQLYLDLSFCEKTIILREIKSKISSYRQQDIDKQIYNPNTIITDEEVIEKLVTSKLRCIYCKCNLHIVYKNQREPTQWTLDRINNNLGHNRDNVVISCLGCNLQKRRRGEEAFKFMKQMVIKKCE